MTTQGNTDSNSGIACEHTLETDHENNRNNNIAESPDPNLDKNLNPSGQVCLKIQSLGLDFYKAICNGNLNDVESALEQGADINLEFSLPYHADEADTAYDDSCPSSKSLDTGNCPLHLACLKGNVELLEFLLRLGAEIDIFNSKGESALHIACKLGHIECVEKLLQYRADVDLCHSLIGGDTPLLTTIACYQPFFPKAKTYLEICRLLVGSQCNVNATDHMGLAPLHIAAMKDDVEVTKVLCEAGADRNMQCRYVMTPLMRAVENEKVMNVRYLLERGSDVNAVSSSGHTALSLCVETHNLEVLMSLLETKPKMYASHADHCPLHYAASHKLLLTLYLLIIHGGYVNTTNHFDRASLLLTLSRRGSRVGVDLLLRCGADANIENRLGTTPVWAAAKLGHMPIIRLLLEYNVDLESMSIEILPLKPLTALQVALEIGHWDIATILLQAGGTLKTVWLAKNNVPRRLRENHELLKMLWAWLRQPCSLQHLCRKVIRDSLGSRIHKKLQRLAYPQRLCDYILTRTL